MVVGTLNTGLDNSNAGFYFSVFKCLTNLFQICNLRNVLCCKFIYSGSFYSYFTFSRLIQSFSVNFETIVFKYF